MSEKKTFVSGIYPRKRNDKAPDWVIGAFGMNVDQLAEWLVQNADKADARGFLNIQMAVGQSGKTYAAIDTWKPKQQEAVQEPEGEPEDLPW